MVAKKRVDPNRIIVNKMRYNVDTSNSITFIGEGGYANLMLKGLLSERVNVVNFLTDRKNRIRIKRGITLEKLIAGKKWITKEDLDHNYADFFVIAFYGGKIPKSAIEAYGDRIINIHPSLLPGFRGRDPIGEMVKKEVKYGGVTVHLVDRGFDTGPVLGQRRFLLDYNRSLDLAVEYSYELAIEHGASLFADVLRNIERIEPISQDEMVDVNMLSLGGAWTSK